MRRAEHKEVCTTALSPYDSRGWGRGVGGGGVGLFRICPPLNLNLSIIFQK